VHARTPSRAASLPAAATTHVSVCDMSAGTGRSEDFRRRRLSVTDQAQMEAQLAAASVSASSPAPRPKRISISMSPEMGQKPKVAMSFPTDLVGTYSCHGVEPGRVEGQAKSKINQDRGVVATPIAEPEDGSYKQALFCVYDGHGAVGDKASQFTADRVIANLEPLLMDGMKEEEALKTAFCRQTTSSNGNARSTRS